MRAGFKGFGSISVSKMSAIVFAFATVAIASQASATLKRPAEPAGEKNYKDRGYFNCVVTGERRALLNEGAGKELCVLSIECEAPGQASVPTSAVCKPIVRNGRCPEARDCLTDDSATAADYAKKTAEEETRTSKDQCYQPSETAKKITAALKKRADQMSTAGSKPAAGASSRAPSAN